MPRLKGSKDLRIRKSKGQRTSSIPNLRLYDYEKNLLRKGFENHYKFQGQDVTKLTPKAYSNLFNDFYRNIMLKKANSLSHKELIEKM